VGTPPATVAKKTKTKILQERGGKKLGEEATITKVHP